MRQSNSITLSFLAIVASCGQPLTPPKQHQEPGAEHYVAGLAFIESRDYPLAQGEIGRINPVTSIVPILSSVASGNLPVCTLSILTQENTPWEHQQTSGNIHSGQRMFRQSGDQLFYFQVNNVTPSGFLQSGSCNIKANRVTDDPIAGDDFAVTRTTIDSKIFEGTLSARVRTSLFNGALTIWTSPNTDHLNSCIIMVSHRNGKPNWFDFSNVPSAGLSKDDFFLPRDTSEGQFLYQFEMSKRSDREPHLFFWTRQAGNCDVKITQYRLPNILSQNISAVSSPSTSGVVSRNVVSAPSDGSLSSIKVNFDAVTRQEIRERDIPVTVQDGTTYAVERTVTSSNEVTFGDTKTLGIDIGSPIVSWITAGLLTSEVKQNWESRFTRGVGQSTSITARVELDPTYCKRWLYSVFATVRDGTIDARSYGEDIPVPFSIVERLEIKATPQC